jgi:phosphoglycolate phosphatase
MRVKAAFQAYYADHCRDYTVAYDGIAALLDRLDADQTATAVISNKPDRFVPEILSALYPHHTFLGAWGQRDEFPRKPSPESLNALIALCGCEKHETLYIGDSNVDVVFAHNAGVKVCGVSWGFRGAGELRKAGADRIVNSAEELYDVIV